MAYVFIIVIIIILELKHLNYMYNNVLQHMEYQQPHLKIQ